MSDCASASELPPPLSTHAHGPSGLRPEWLADSHQPGSPHAGAVRGQPSAGLPLRPHSGVLGHGARDVVSGDGCVGSWCQGYGVW